MADAEIKTGCQFEALDQLGAECPPSVVDVVPTGSAVAPVESEKEGMIIGGSRYGIEVVAGSRRSGYSFRT